MIYVCIARLRFEYIAEHMSREPQSPCRPDLSLGETRGAAQLEGESRLAAGFSANEPGELADGHSVSGAWPAGCPAEPCKSVAVN